MGLTQDLATAFKLLVCTRDCVCVCVHMCAYVCVWEGERENVCGRERECVCVCVGERECMWERERVCVCLWERERECLCVCLRKKRDKNGDQLMLQSFGYKQNWGAMCCRHVQAFRSCNSKQTSPWQKSVSFFIFYSGLVWLWQLAFLR